MKGYCLSVLASVAAFAATPAQSGTDIKATGQAETQIARFAESNKIYVSDLSVKRGRIHISVWGPPDADAHVLAQIALRLSAVRALRSNEPFQAVASMDLLEQYDAYAHRTHRYVDLLVMTSPTAGNIIDRKGTAYDLVPSASVLDAADDNLRQKGVISPTVN